jgi:hypothetical protein
LRGQFASCCGDTAFADPVGTDLLYDCENEVFDAS